MEYHWYEDYWTMPRNLPKGHQFFIGYYQTQRAIRFHVENIHTDQSVFLSTWLLDNRYRVFLHYCYEQRIQSTYQPHQTQRCTAKAHFLTEVHLRTQGIENRGSTSVLPRFIRLSRQRTRHSCSCRICAAQ